LKAPVIILFLLQAVFIFLQPCYAQHNTSRIDFFGELVEVPSSPKSLDYKTSLSDISIRSFIENTDSKTLEPFLNVLLQYKQQHAPDDWLYYQAVRKVAQYISPKAENYYRYTFYKWWLLVNSGYNAILTYSNNYLLFYVQSDENIYNIPYRLKDGKQYVCLNYHDYGNIDFEKNRFTEVSLQAPANVKPFSYKVTHLPDFNEADYTEKEVQFNYHHHQYQFHIRLNAQVKTIFTNYPVVDYELQCNMPLSRSTYQSLIPSLIKATNKLNIKDGVDFLMRFTRYAFLFKPDGETFGGEKRMSPEQTLLYESSDCEDRAALFFYLVKEIYNLPMLVLTYPNHVTVAVKFEKPYGQTINYNGTKYSVCEPSPQRLDLQIGQLLPELSENSYQIAYVYQPALK
jgi:hypothetical protein